MHVLEKKVDLHVVPLLNYERIMPLAKNLFSPLSPNIPSINACYGYSFLGLMGEVRPFDCGLGTDHPMGCLGLSVDIVLPDAHWTSLQKKLAALGLASEFFRYYSPRKKKMCRGLRFIIDDINTIPSYQVLVHTLKFFHDEGVVLTFSKHFDVAVGTHLVREYIQGNASKKDLDARVLEALSHFSVQAHKVCLYKPFPQIG
jgi:uncharacterized protein YbbC (DUF1343 family)